MALDFTQLLIDIRQESDWLFERLNRLDVADWGWPTPAQGWSVRDQVSHLAFFDDSAWLALTDPAAFRAQADELMADGMDFPDRVAADHRVLSPDRLLAWFTGSREQLLLAFAAEDPKRRLPWFGPDMSVASSATARLMETWAHGQDVYDTVGVDHPVSPGLRNIAHLGVATFAFAHQLNGRAVPDEPVHVELESPDGQRWAWGPDDAANAVHGTAQDFVLTVTQRRHWRDTDLTVAGPVAAAWLDIAQAFAGAPGSGRPVARQ